MNDKIKQLQAEIAKEQEKMRKCKHSFDKAFYNPEEVLEGYGLHTVANGSDIYSEYTGYRTVMKYRWTRVCIFCGKQEHTSTTKPIISGYEPNFG